MGIIDWLVHYSKPIGLPTLARSLSALIGEMIRSKIQFHRYSRHKLRIEEKTEHGLYIYSLYVN